MKLGLQVPDFTWPGGLAEMGIGPAIVNSPTVARPGIFDLFAALVDLVDVVVPAGR